MPRKHQSSNGKGFTKWRSAQIALDMVDNKKAFKYLFSIQYNKLYPEGSGQKSTKRLAKDCAARIVEMLGDEEKETKPEDWQKFCAIADTLSSQQIISLTTYCCQDINQNEVARLRILLNDVDKQSGSNRFSRYNAHYNKRRY